MYITEMVYVHVLVVYIGILDMDCENYPEIEKPKFQT